MVISTEKKTINKKGDILYISKLNLFPCNFASIEVYEAFSGKKNKKKKS